MSDHTSGQNGKGDGERVTDRRRFNKNYDKVFGPQKEAEIDSEEEDSDDQ